MNVDGERLAVAFDEQLVFVAHVAEQLADGGHGNIGGGFVVDAFNHVAFLNTGVRAGRARIAPA